MCFSSCSLRRIACLRVKGFFTGFLALVVLVFLLIVFFVCVYRGMDRKLMTLTCSIAHFPSKPTLPFISAFIGR